MSGGLPRGLEWALSSGVQEGLEAWVRQATPGEVERAISAALEEPWTMQLHRGEFLSALAAVVDPVPRRLPDLLRRDLGLLEKLAANPAADSQQLLNLQLLLVGWVSHPNWLGNRVGVFRILRTLLDRDEIIPRLIDVLMARASRISPWGTTGYHPYAVGPCLEMLAVLARELSPDQKCRCILDEVVTAPDALDLVESETDDPAVLATFVGRDDLLREAPVRVRLAAHPLLPQVPALRDRLFELASSDRDHVTLLRLLEWDDAGARSVFFVLVDLEPDEAAEWLEARAGEGATPAWFAALAPSDLVELVGVPHHGLRAAVLKALGSLGVE